MGQNDVVFVKGQGGLGRALPGEDYISAINFYCSNGSLPSGFTTSDRIKQVFSIQDAEALGITDTYSDETKSTATYLVTNAGATGDVAVFKVAEPKAVVTLGTYTRPATDTTVTLVGAGIAAAINLNTVTHGYTATAATGTVTITARPGLGVYLNTGTPYSATITGTIAGTLTQNVVAGIASRLAIYHYHISEYFRIQPQGNLYVGFYATPGGAYDFADITLVQNFANGKIRQFAVWIDSTAFTTAMITAAQLVATALEADHKPLSILIGGDISGTADVGSLGDLAGLSSPKVSVVIGQDGVGVTDGVSVSGLGYDLFKAFSKSITCVGATLGAVSLAKVNEDIAWVGKFNLTDGTELNTPAFANGQNFKDVTTAKANLVNLYRYIFIKNFVGTNGTYFNDSHCAVAYTSDYAYIENNRTIDKAIRLMRPALLPLLNSPIVLNSNGTMSDTAVGNFETVGDGALAKMIRDGELSGNATTVNPAQNVQSTGKVVISEKLLGVGVARNIEVDIGFVLSL